MSSFFKSLRYGALIAAAAAGLAVGIPTVAQAGSKPHIHFHFGGPLYYGYHYHGRCSYWRSVCSSRWGFGSGLYHRCLWRHGC